MLSINAFLKYRSKIVKLAEISLLTGGATSGDTKTDLQNVRQFKEGTFFIRHTGLVGTTKTLDVKIVSKDPSGAFYEDLVSFTQITADGVAGGEKKPVTANMGENLAIEWTKGHADIVTTFTVYGVCK
jgi:hypothetical protein